MYGYGKRYRTGVWNGVRFSGIPPQHASAFMPMFVYNETEISMIYEVRDSELFARITVNYLGFWKLLEMNRSEGQRGMS